MAYLIHLSHILALFTISVTRDLHQTDIQSLSSRTQRKALLQNLPGHLESTRGDNQIALITAVSFIEPHLIDKGQHTTLEKISKNVYTKTSKIIVI